MDMTKLIEDYIASKKDSWSPSTQSSERYRLRGIEFEMLTDPELLWKHLADKKLKPYAVKTAFIRAGELLEFAMSIGAIKAGQNKLKFWMNANANKFKHAYKPKAVSISFEDALKLIATMPDEENRTEAERLLFTGLRVSERADENGQVTGKGGYHREVPIAKELGPSSYTSNRTTLYRHLKKLGLTPHMLRKLSATKFAECGGDIPDLMKQFGWRSTQMAAIYVQAQKQKEINAELSKLMPNRKPKGDKGDK